MSINCEVTLRWDATPEQQRALGRALWAWCNRAARGAGDYQYLDNQGLADLLAGTLPAAALRAGDGSPPRALFSVPGDSSRDREAVLESLRKAIPVGGIAGVRVDGLGWRPAEVRCPATAAVPPAPRPGPFSEVVPNALECGTQG